MYSTHADNDGKHAVLHASPPTLIWFSVVKLPVVWKAMKLKLILLVPQFQGYDGSG